MDIRNALLMGRAKLAGKSDYSARDAALLLAHILDCPTEDLYLHPEKPVTPGEFGAYTALLDRRAQREPIAYIVGYKEFMGFRFKVDGRVLIPRPETEILVETALKLAVEMIEGRQEVSPGSLTVCDVCCGSGAIGLSMLKLLSEAVGSKLTVSQGQFGPAQFAGSRTDLCKPYICKFILTDISPGALEVAKENARQLSIDDGADGDFNASVLAEFLLGDGLEPLRNRRMEGRVDIIVSNPPYIPRDEIVRLDDEVKSFEPHLALDGGYRGMEFIHKLIAQAACFLKPGGYLVMEIGHDQADQCREAFSAFSTLWCKWFSVQDYSGIERVFASQKA